MSQRLVDAVVDIAAECGDRASTWLEARRIAYLEQLAPVKVIRRISDEFGDEWADELYQRARANQAAVEIAIDDVTHVGDEESTLGWLLHQLLALRDAKPGEVFLRVAIGQREIDVTGVSVVRRGSDSVVLIR